MDKRELADHFRVRLREVLDANGEGKAALLRRTGIDRSALSQFLSADKVRLPRAEVLRRLAVSSGVSVDWLLAIENAPTVVSAVAFKSVMNELVDVAFRPALPSNSFLVPNCVLAAIRSIVARALVISAWLAANASESFTPSFAESRARLRTFTKRLLISLKAPSAVCTRDTAFSEFSMACSKPAI